MSGRLSTHIYFEPITYFYVIDTLAQGDFAACGDVLWHLFLPALTLGTIPMAVIARMTRASLLDVLGEDYIRTAWAKGLRERVVIVRHALKTPLYLRLRLLPSNSATCSGARLSPRPFSLGPGLTLALFGGTGARLSRRAGWGFAAGHGLCAGQPHRRHTLRLAGSADTLRRGIGKTKKWRQRARPLPPLFVFNSAYAAGTALFQPPEEAMVMRTISATAG